MSFRNENEAICGHGGAIYNLDIKTDSKKVLLASTAKLLAQKRHQDSLELDNLRSVLNDPTCSVDHLENPVEVDGRIYFSSFVCAANRKCVSLVSTDAHFDDLHVHLQFNQGLVQSIRIAGKGNYVAMRLWPNPLVKEKLAPGWYFLNDGLSGYLEDAEPSNMANPVHKSSLVEYSRR